jgi:hypothetical protein
VLASYWFQFKKKKEILIKDSKKQIVQIFLTTLYSFITISYFFNFVIYIGNIFDLFRKIKKNKVANFLLLYVELFLIFGLFLFYF